MNLDEMKAGVEKAMKQADAITLLPMGLIRFGQEQQSICTPAITCPKEIADPGVS